MTIDYPFFTMVKHKKLIIKAPESYKSLGKSYFRVVPSRDVSYIFYIEKINYCFKSIIT